MECWDGCLPKVLSLFEWLEAEMDEWGVEWASWDKYLMALKTQYPSQIVWIESIWANDNFVFGSAYHNIKW